MCVTGDLVASHPVLRRIVLVCFNFVCVIASLLVVEPRVDSRLTWTECGQPPGPLVLVYGDVSVGVSA